MAGPFQTLVGNTIKSSWVASGTSPTDVWFAVFDRDETLVASMTMVQSASDQYYANYTVPNTPGFWVAEWGATMGSKPYRNRQQFQTVLEDIA